MKMHNELEVIMKLMEELQEKMEPGEEDFEERLGRKKPGVEVVKIEGEMPGEDDGMDGEDMGGEDFAMDFEEPESPEEKLKKRIMKLRG